LHLTGFRAYNTNLVLGANLLVSCDDLLQPIVALLAQPWLVVYERFVLLDLGLERCLLFIHLLQRFVALVAVLKYLELEIVASSEDGVDRLSDVAVALNSLNDKHFLIINRVSSKWKHSKRKALFRVSISSRADQYSKAAK
jgi:hypothetical protein